MKDFELNDTFDNFTFTTTEKLVQNERSAPIKPQQVYQQSSNVSFDDSIFLSTSCSFSSFTNTSLNIDACNDDGEATNKTNLETISTPIPQCKGKESKMQESNKECESIIEKNNTSIEENVIQSDLSTVSIKDINCLEDQINTNLSSWGLPDTILQKYEDRKITQMFPWQVECLTKPGILNDHKNLVYSAPTSAGKTLVAEILAIKTVLERQKKVIFILPFVSVVREKMFYFQDILGANGVRVEGFMGSYNPPGGFRKVQVAICTIEKANSLVNRLLEESRLKDIGAVIVDEMHLLGDPSRGYLLELLLTKLRYMSLKDEDVNIQIIGMSATLPNLKLLADWLDAELFTTDFRPIPLHEQCIVHGEIYNSEFKLLRKLVGLPELGMDTDNVLQLCLETIKLSCSVLIFCPSKNWCENLAQQIASAFWKLGSANGELGSKLREQLNAVMISECLEQLKRCPVGLDQILGKTVSYGVAFHHAGLTIDERDIVESAFRNGSVRVLIATSTLSSGVNLPARRVIIRSPMFNGKPIDTLTYRQMIGRAGRMGKDTEGESILICQKNDYKIVKELMSAKLRPIESCLEGAGKLKRAILEVITSDVASSPDDIELFTKCTLLASDTNRDGEITNPIDDSISFLIDNEFIRLQSDMSKYVATSLAKACLSSSLPPEEGLALFTELEKARQCFVLETELHLIYLVTPYSACNQMGNIDWMVYLEMWEKLPASMKRVGELVGVRVSYIINGTRGKMQTNTSKLYHKLQVHKRFYTALALQDLVNEVPLNQVANKFGCNRGMLQSLQQSAATFAGMVTSFSKQLGWSSVEILVSQFQDRLQFGISRDLLDLMRLPLLNGQRARILYNAGVETLVDLANTDVYTLENILHKAKPFETEKEREGESTYDADKRNKLRTVWVTGKQGLTEKEAAELMIRDARTYLQLELGLRDAHWEDDDQTKESVKENTPQSCESPLNKENEVTKQEKNRRCTKNRKAKSRESRESISSEDERPQKQRKRKHLRKKDNDKSDQKHISSYSSDDIYSESDFSETVNLIPPAVLEESKKNVGKNMLKGNINKNKEVKELSSKENKEILDLNVKEKSNVIDAEGKELINKNIIYQKTLDLNFKVSDSDAKESKKNSQQGNLKINLNPDQLKSTNSNSSARKNILECTKNVGKQENNKNTKQQKIINNKIVEDVIVRLENTKTLPHSNTKENEPKDLKENIKIETKSKENPRLRRSFVLDKTIGLEQPINKQTSPKPLTNYNIVTRNSLKQCTNQINSNRKSDKVITRSRKSLERINPRKSETCKPVSVEIEDEELEISTSSSHNIMDFSIDEVKSNNVSISSNHKNESNHSDQSLFEDSFNLDSKILHNISDFEDDKVDVGEICIDDFGSQFDSKILKNISNSSSCKDLEENPLIKPKIGVEMTDLDFNTKLLEDISQMERMDNLEPIKEENLDVINTSSGSNEEATNTRKRSRNLTTNQNDLTSIGCSPMKKAKLAKTRTQRSSSLCIDTTYIISTVKSNNNQSVVKDDEEEFVDLTKFEIVDVCRDKKLFECFRNELIGQKEIAISLGCERIAQAKPLIGIQLVKKENDGNFVYKNIQLKGVSICWGGNTTYYVDFVDSTITNEGKVNLLRGVFESGIRIKIFDSKEQIKVLKQCTNIDFNCCCDDPKVAYWLQDPEGREKNLQSLMVTYAPEGIKLCQMAGTSKGVGSMGLDLHSSIDARLRCSIESVVTWHLTNPLKSLLREQEEGLIHTYDIEMNCLIILSKMELTGFGVNIKEFQALQDKIKDYTAAIETKAFQIAGRRFSFTSSTDVAKVLGIYRGKKISTNKKVLHQNENPISSLILLWRRLNSALTKMVYPLLRLVENGRIYGRHITHSSTGRISMHEPNLQNMPRDFEFVHPLSEEKVWLSCRRAFCAKDKNVLVSADYCQLELRLLAHFSQDRILCEIMKTDDDVFKSIAAKWNNISRDEVTDLIRQQTKQICYGIIYGMGVKTLAEQLCVEEDEALEFTEAFHQKYPGIKQFITTTVTKCKESGYVQTIAGRRRYLPYINDTNPSIKNQAERQAVNTMIQGSAADIVKNVMMLIENKINDKFKSSRNKPKMVLHLHDELMYEVPSKYQDIFSKLLKRCMQDTVQLSVPFPVKVKYGPTWSDMKDYTV